MKKRLAHLILACCTWTAGVAVAGYKLVGSVSHWGLGPGGLKGAESVRHFHWFRLVRPESVGGSDMDLVLNWAIAELRARIYLALCLWVAGIIVLFWRYFKNDRTLGAA